MNNNSEVVRLSCVSGSQKNCGATRFEGLLEIG